MLLNLSAFSLWYKIFGEFTFFHGFSKLYKKNLDMNFRNSEHSYLPWGHFRCHTKFGPDRFSRLNVYWIQRNRQTATDKQSIFNFSLRRVISSLTIRWEKKRVPSFFKSAQSEIQLQFIYCRVLYKHTIISYNYKELNRDQVFWTLQRPLFEFI